MTKTPSPHPIHQGPSVERIELVNLLARMGQQAEAQAPGESQIAPLIRHLMNLAAAPPERVADDWEAIAAAAFNGSERVVALVDAPKRRPATRRQPA